MRRVTAAILLVLGLSIGVLALVYTVQPGDSLWRIGQSFGVSVADLKTANKLNSDKIMTGQKLTVPNSGPYTVRAGDTLWRIAQANSVSVEALKAANHLTTDVIRVGQVLTIPAPGSPAPPTSDQPDFSALQKQVQDYVNAQPATYKVYFQDLKSGASFGIGENDWMVGASSTKVPTVLYLYTLADQGKVNLKDTVAYQDADYQDGAGSLQFYIKPGDQIPLGTLANLAITQSDNIAHRMLLRYLGKDSVAAFMKSLGGQTVYPDGSNITTAKDLATYIKAVLAFAEKSQYGAKLLYDLEHTIWNAGLNGQLPASVTVAHKEGDVTGVSNDVGVVYASRPYLLVVMSKNQADSDAGFKYIAQISRMAYDYEESLAK
ncbi:MAG: serine hydrolase [Chitinophagales bacterium]